jgi:2-keto-4-pentenoate hydratase
MCSEAPNGHELIANNAIHAGVIRGKGVTCQMALPESNHTLNYDREIVDSWAEILWLHDILSSIQWLADKLDGDGKRLKKGDTILTGALGPPVPVGDARQVEAISSALGNVSATFV